MEVRLGLACEAAEMDEQWPFVGNKSNQRRLWYAVDHATNIILATVFGKRKDGMFTALKALLEPLSISRYDTSDGSAYQHYIEADKHQVGKRNAQKIERKNLNFRTWIKRLTRKQFVFRN